MTLPNLNVPISKANLLDVLGAVAQNSQSGTSNAPGVSFEKNQSTGLYLRPDGGIGISANALVALYVDGEGNVYIPSLSGDMTVSGSLDVEGNLTVSGNANLPAVIAGYVTAAGDSHFGGHLTVNSADPQFGIQAEDNSSRVAITFGSSPISWQIGINESSDGEDNFYFYHGTKKTNPIIIWSDDSISMPGVVTVGASNSINTQSCLIVSPVSNGTPSKRATILIGSGGGSSDGWTFGRDDASAGGNDLFFYSGTAKKIRLWMDDDGVAFNGLSPVAAPTLNDAVPQDGTATNASMASLLNQIRLALINNGLCLG